MIRRDSWWFGLLLFALGAAVPGCRREGLPEARSAEGPAEPLRAQVVAVQAESWPRVVRVQGSLMADEHVVIGAKVAGRVKQVRVDLGSPVRRGEVLVTLDTEDLDLKVKQAEAQLQQARAKLGLKASDKEETLDRTKLPAVVEAKALWDQAKANLQRAKSLAEEKAIAVEDLQQRQAVTDVAEAKYGAALNDAEEQVALVGVRRADLAVAKQTRDDAEVRAPFDAVVQQRQVAPGAYLQVGQPVVSLVKVHPLRFHAGVPEREAVQVRAGQAARIIVEGQREPIDVTVSRIGPALDTASRSLAVEADVPNAGSQLRVGLFAEAEITADPQARTLAVAATAIRQFAGVEKVWLVRNGEAAEQVVQTGRREAGRVEILQGLSKGDLVLVDAQKGRRGPVAALGPSPAGAGEVKE